MAILTKDTILQADDLKRELVPVPEWGGDVYVRTLMGSEKEEFSDTLFEYDDKGLPTRKPNYLVNMKVGMLVRAICDKDGKRIFSNEDASVLAGKSSVALARLDEVCNRLNGVKAKVVEDKAKN